MCGINEISKDRFCILYLDQDSSVWRSARYLQRKRMGGDGTADLHPCCVEMSNELLKDELKYDRSYGLVKDYSKGVTKIGNKEVKVWTFFWGIKVSGWRDAQFWIGER